jgi:hypothetical protein
MTDRELIERLLFLAETAVDQALDLNYDDPEDYFIYRELRELKAAALAQPEPQAPTDEELWDLYQDLGSYFSPTEFARTVLARWGRPAIEPVPVSERPPGPKDCDAGGRCWWFSPPACGPCTIRPCWIFDSETLEGDTHWLPHWALPVPAPANTINQNNY